MLRFIIIILALATPLTFAQTLPSVKGYVYQDLNGDGKRDKNEPGISGVLVSTMDRIGKTDQDGLYNLPLDPDRDMVFVIKPAGYQVPLNADNLPQFYYIHQPQGSPQGLKFPGIAPTGKLPASVDFALSPSPDPVNFRLLVSGDPQPRDSTEVGYYRDAIVTAMMGEQADAIIALGDIAYDDLSIYPQLNRAIGKLGLPAYYVYGNHDVNYRAEDNYAAGETFKSVYGPLYYAAVYGKVHIIPLSSVYYHGWNKAENKRGAYTGDFTTRQLNWLRQYLALVPADHLVVPAMHIPVFSKMIPGADVTDSSREALFEVLRGQNHILGLFGHTHLVEHVAFGEEQGWKGPGEFWGINPGAGCGSWWSGPKDENGIPTSYCLDGSPKGFFVVDFNWNRYTARFVPANLPERNQMRISFPAGVLPADSLKGRDVLANIFAAPPDAEVSWRLNDGEAMAMVRAEIKDPFIVGHLAAYRKDFPTWIERTADVVHLWRAALPENLPAGTHKITVSVRDRFGNAYQGYQLFEILP